jgi:hypothetical protein
VTLSFGVAREEMPPLHRRESWLETRSHGRVNNGANALLSLDAIVLATLDGELDGVPSNADARNNPLWPAGSALVGGHPASDVGSLARIGPAGRPAV